MKFIKKHPFITIFVAILLSASIIFWLILGITQPTTPSNQASKESTQSAEKGKISDTQAITEFIKAQPGKVATITVKNVTIKEEQGGYKLVFVDTYDNETNIPFTEVAIIKDGEVITGITSHLDREDLEFEGVPDDIITAYEESTSDY